MGRILVDTNILSTAYLPEPPTWLWDWLESLPAGALAVSWVVIYETEYGIRAAQRHNPTRAIELLAWFTEFLGSRLTFPDMNIQASRLLGQMAATPAMKHFFLTEDRNNKNGERLKIDRIRLGGDAMLAALAISHQLPLATLNTKDFLHIDSHFRLPGLYDPKMGVWLIDPPVGWGLCDNANDDRTDLHAGWIKNTPHR